MPRRIATRGCLPSQIALILRVSAVATRAQGLVRDFGPVRALDHLTLEVPAGIVFGFLGPNGAGKSTLGKILAGDPEYTVERGEILLDGENILELSPDERARKGLFLAFHHLVIDAVSWRILAEDLARVSRGEPLPAKGSSYRQWVRHC